MYKEVQFFSLSGALHPLGTEEKERAEDIQGNVMVGGGIAERIGAHHLIFA